MSGATLARRWSRDIVLPVRRARGERLVDARDVSVTLGGRAVLDAVHLHVDAGEVVALVGPNGAGKSTLLAALTGEAHLVEGSIELDGASLGSWSHADLARRRAVLPQHVTVSFPFSVTDVVRMGRAPWGRTGRAEEDDAVIADALRVTDVARLATRPFPTLSGGERARVALARVLAQRTQLLLLDEPTASLDVHHQELVLDVARRRAAAGDGVVAVLHDLGLAAAHADRVVVLSKGRVVADGPPAEVLTPARLTEVYRHDIEVLEHPVTGALLVVPRRRPLLPPGAGRDLLS
jgi:iron complex transport system ATP-binding protein